MWSNYVEDVRNVLSNLVVTDYAGTVLATEYGFECWLDLAVNLTLGGGIHIIGNGASASMASHFAADITKNCGLRALVFTDCALITALGNDNGFENAYAVALNRYSSPGDLLIAISSSGKSQNILNACQEARRLKVLTVTISGKKSDNPLRTLGDLNFYVPAESYSLAESAHAVILHHWIDCLEVANRKGQMLRSNRRNRMMATGM